jgi:hypothetical protein
MVLLGGVDQVEDHFSMFGDSVNLDTRLVHGFVKHTIGSEIILGATNGTPM